MGADRFLIFMYWKITVIKTLQLILVYQHQRVRVNTTGRDNY